jgi:hypothetical protein
MGGKEKISHNQDIVETIKNKQDVKIKIFEFYQREKNFQQIPHLQEEYKNFMK